MILSIHKFAGFKAHANDPWAEPQTFLTENLLHNTDNFEGNWLIQWLRRSSTAWANIIIFLLFSSAFYSSSDI